MSEPREESGTLEVIRIRQYANRLRRIWVRVDGKRALALGHGETGEIRLPAGRHRVEASIDWSRSRPLDLSIEAGGRSRVEISCRARGWRLALSLVYVLWPRGYLELRPRA